VILVDANLLIYAATECREQASAKAWLDAQLSSGARVGLPWASLTTFLRIVTNARIYGTGAAQTQVAWNVVRGWLDCGNVWIPQPTSRHAEVLGELLKAGRVAGDLVQDADLAALAIEHGLTIYSSDSDFARFGGVKWVNPLV